MNKEGNMTELELFAVSESLKDRYTRMLKDDLKFNFSDEALEAASKITANVINKFNKAVDEGKTRDGIAFLLDTISYFVMVSTDLNETNQTLVNLLEEFIVKDGTDQENKRR